MFKNSVQKFFAQGQTVYENFLEFKLLKKFCSVILCTLLHLAIFNNKIFFELQ